VKIDFDHAGVGGDFEEIEAMIVRRRAAFDDHGQLECCGRFFHRADQIQVSFRRSHRRHENAEAPVAHFDRERRTHSVTAAVHGAIED